MGGDTEGGAPLVTQYVLEDSVPWYKKPNLRYLYIVLLPTCIGVEITSGFVWLPSIQSLPHANQIPPDLTLV